MDRGLTIHYDLLPLMFSLRNQGCWDEQSGTNQKAGRLDVRLVTHFALRNVAFAWPVFYRIPEECWAAGATLSRAGC
jgi:hypothetical protein